MTPWLRICSTASQDQIQFKISMEKTMNFLWHTS